MSLAKSLKLGCADFVPIMKSSNELAKESDSTLDNSWSASLSAFNLIATSLSFSSPSRSFNSWICFSISGRFRLARIIQKQLCHWRFFDRDSVLDALPLDCFQRFLSAFNEGDLVRQREIMRSYILRFLDLRAHAARFALPLPASLPHPLLLFFRRFLDLLR